MLVRLLAYLSGLAILAVIAADLLAMSPIQVNSEASVPLRTHDLWAVASRPQPAFDLPVTDLFDKTASYEIFRHPEGGRRDVLSWPSASGDIASAQIEIYRPGSELADFGAPGADIAPQLLQAGLTSMQPAGLLNSKFGPVALLQFADRAATPRQCLGFSKTFDTETEPRLRISGWFCQGDTMAAQRLTATCALNRLTLLSAGGDGRLAELFARAELKRGDCGARSEIRSTANDWTLTAQAPQLRGALDRN